MTVTTLVYDSKVIPRVDSKQYDLLFVKRTTVHYCVREIDKCARYQRDRM